MSNKIKKRRRNLMKRIPYCYWCGRKVIDPVDCKDKNQPNMATLDHLNTHFDKERIMPNYIGEERTVLSCLECNHKKGAEREKRFLRKLEYQRRIK